MIRTYIGQRLAALSPAGKLALMIGADTLCLPLCVLVAVALRLSSFEAAFNVPAWAQLLLGLSTLPILGSAGLYRTVVRYIDLRVIAASGLSLAAAVLVMFLVARVMEVSIIPRAAMLMFWFIAFTYVITSRFIARALLRQGLKRGGRPRTRTAIYGAGDAGAQLAHSMQLSPEYKAVCFLDDRAQLHAKTVAGLKVYAPDRLEEAIYRHDVTQIVVAIPSATKAQKRELIARVEKTGLPVKIVPGLVDLVNGNVTLTDIRGIEVTDLLGRDPVPPDANLFARNIRGKSVLVTGAGGSIGSELCRQILSQAPRKLVLLDHAEFSLYAIEQELRQVGGGTEIVQCLGSVLDESLLRRTCRGHRVQTIYHAAAYKHVPLVERNVQQGIRNNVFGTQALASAALATGVETCVLVSTDKAVRPTNMMGATKRAAELVFQSAALRGKGRTVFSMVRFGNVLGSSGSVVPLFKKQIEAGGPITITHPDVIRYFMIIPEAAQLVIQAGALAKGGEVFVLDMGEPVRILDLARSMIHLSGLSERTTGDQEGDIEIQYVGLRPGEKMYEELLIGNDSTPSVHPRILCAREHCVEPALLDKMIESLKTACDHDDVDGMVRQMKNLVPEYTASVEVCQEAAVAGGPR